MYRNSLIVTAVVVGVFVLGIAQASEEQATTAPATTAPVATPPALTDVTVSQSADPVNFDGHVSIFEYADAAKFNFTAGHGQVTAYLKQYDGWMYFGFEIPEPTVHPGDDIVVMLNLDDPALEKPSEKCIRAYVRRKMENSRMHKGDGEKWVNLYGPFEYKHVTYNQGWEAEIRVPLAEIGVVEGEIKSLPVAFRIWDDSPLMKWNWPADADENRPSSWGKLTITAAKIDSK